MRKPKPGDLILCNGEDIVICIAAIQNWYYLYWVEPYYGREMWFPYKLSDLNYVILEHNAFPEMALLVEIAVGLRSGKCTVDYIHADKKYNEIVRCQMKVPPINN